MSVFEIIMLLCFGAAWPTSIIKSWRARKNGSKSLVFLVVIIAGYLAGITHKLLYNRNLVMWLYVLNACMVSIDAALWIRNARLEKEEAASAAASGL